MSTLGLAARVVAVIVGNAAFAFAVTLLIRPSGLTLVGTSAVWLAWGHIVTYRMCRPWCLAWERAHP